MRTQFNEMVSNLKKPGQDILDSWTPTKASAAHMLTGLCDEFFEFSESVVNAVNYLVKTENEKIAGTQYALHIVEEAGDAFFYIQGLVEDLDLPKIEFTPSSQCEGHIGGDSMLTIITLVKRHLYYNKDLPLDELHTALQTLAHLMATVVEETTECTAEDIMEANMTKLMKGRYKQGYSDTAANKREDKEEGQ